MVLFAFSFCDLPICGAVARSHEIGPDGRADCHGLEVITSGINEQDLSGDVRGTSLRGSVPFFFSLFFPFFLLFKNEVSLSVHVPFLKLLGNSIIQASYPVYGLPLLRYR